MVVGKPDGMKGKLPFSMSSMNRVRSGNATSNSTSLGRLLSFVDDRLGEQFNSSRQARYPAFTVVFYVQSRQSGLGGQTCDNPRQ